MAEQIPESHVNNSNGVPPPVEETRDGGCFRFLTKKEDKITEDVVMGPPDADKEEKHTLMDELRRAHSHHSTSSSDEEVEEGGGERQKKKKKKGLKEAITDKLSGEKDGEDAVPMEKCSEEENAETGQPEEKKGFLEKIKERLPGQTKKGEDETQTPPPAAAVADCSPGSDSKEKKGILDKIKEKLPGHHNNN